MILTPNSQAQLSTLDLAGSFAGMMHLYERNYILIRRLVPDMPAQPGHYVSQIKEGLALHLELIERFPYTTELMLTYVFDRDNHQQTEPDLRLRVYHDARLAEVMEAHLRHWPRFSADQDDSNDTRLRSRWHVNRFLYKWLSYCVYQGHRFRFD